MQTIHPISDTGLAAAIATLGIPLDPAQAMSRTIDTRTGQERVRFMFQDGIKNPEGVPSYLTEHVVGWWEKRHIFEAASPGHPMVHMRAALDARRYLLDVINARRPLPQDDYTGDRHEAGLLWEAAILKAHGFPLLATTGTAFAFPNVWKGRYARQVIEQSRRAEGRSPAQWMKTFLLNFSQFLDAAKKAVPTAITQEEGKCLLLSVAASDKVVDQFHAEFERI